jgi:hypothetical protein
MPINQQAIESTHLKEKHTSNERTLTAGLITMGGWVGDELKATIDP